MSLSALLILALAQGLTEFLPVSSSAHLVFLKDVLRFTEHGIETEMWLHFATLVALLIYFHKDIYRLTLELFGKAKDAQRSNWVPLILISTVITGAAGVFGRKFLLGTFTNAREALIELVITGLILLPTRWAREKRDQLDWKDAALFGAAQALAILPGVSRSGATIACLLFLGVRHETAFRYSFLASIPAIGGAFILELKEGSFAGFTPMTLSLSFLVAFVTGYLSLILLKKFVVQNRFYLFGLYCIAAGAAGLFWLATRT